MLLAWPMCRSPFGSGGKRVRILAGSGPPWAWWAASPGLPAQRRLAEGPFARSDLMTRRREVLGFGGGGGGGCFLRGGFGGRGGGGGGVGGGGGGGRGMRRGCGRSWGRF